jgi:hypothetical protein
MTLVQRRAVSSIAAVVFSAVAAAAIAQAPAAPGASTKHQCESPGDYPGRMASDNQKRSWQKGVNAYLDCLKKFVADTQALADPYIKAANAAIEEYNSATKKFNDQIKAANPD